MTEFTRHRSHRSMDVDVSADDFWKVLIDWTAVLSWMPQDFFRTPPTSANSKPGHVLGEFPFTRVVRLSATTDKPATSVEETLLYADDATKFILYTIEGMGVGGMRNYFATTEVDDLGPNTSRVTIDGRFDLPAGVSPDRILGYFHEVYERGVIGGITSLIKTGVTVTAH